MNNLENSAIEAQVTQYQPTKNPYDSRFNGEEKIVRDGEGFLYRVDEIDLWFEKSGVTKELAESLRNSSRKLTLQPFWEKDDWEGFKKAWDEIEAYVNQKVDVTALKRIRPTNPCCKLKSFM